MLETEFAVGGRVVHAAIFTPSGTGPFPGVVLVEGSGSGTRHDWGWWARFFVDVGCVVLTHDKAGCGDTAGSWLEQSLTDRVDETVAAHGALRKQGEVDPARVGLFGLSQGGWVNIASAARDSSVAFLILVSTPGVSPYEQEEASLVQRMRRAGADAGLLEPALQHWRALVALARTGAPGDELARYQAAAADEPWFEQMHPEWLDPVLLEFLARIGDYDPLPDLRHVSCPLLAIYGANDDFVPVEASKAAIAQEAAAADLTIEVFDGADHNLFTGPPPSGPGEEPPFAPGYLDLLTQWTQRVTRIPTD